MIVPNVVTRPPALQPAVSPKTRKFVNAKTKVRSPQSTLGKVVSTTGYCYCYCYCCCDYYGCCYSTRGRIS